MGSEAPPPKGWRLFKRADFGPPRAEPVPKGVELCGLEDDPTGQLDMAKGAEPTPRGWLVNGAPKGCGPH